jgi:hypothetical protein
MTTEFWILTFITAGLYVVIIRDIAREVRDE